MTTNPAYIAAGPGNRGQRNFTAKGRQKQASPLIKLTKLLSKTLQQPLGLPTLDQAAEMKLLCVEVDNLLEYRRTHPKWRQEGRWI